MRVETAERLNKVSDSYWNFVEEELRGEDRGYFMSLSEISKMLGVNRERVRQIEAKALSKLRHPKRSKLLKPFL